MRKSIQQSCHALLLSIVLILLYSSCSLIGINVHSKTPKKEKPYPVFTQADSLRGSLNISRSCYDVHFYDLNLSVDIKNERISGYVDMYFLVQAPTNSIQIDLFENMTLEEVIWEKQALQFNRRSNAAFITFPAVLQQGRNTKIRMRYQGKPQEAKRPPWRGGFVWKKDKKGNPWIGVACEGDGAAMWWPLKDHGSDEADSCAINVSIPRGLFCVANGKLRNRLVSGDTETFSWFVSNPINRYNVNFTIGNFAPFTVAYTNGEAKHDLHFYPLAENLEKAQKHFTQAISMLRIFENTFGEYAFWQDDYKLIETPFAGMEHQSAIAYGSKYKNFYPYDFDYIILHETAHEWWGNSLTAEDMCDVWLQEGFATYSEALYVEQRYSYQEYLKYLSLYKLLIKNNHPVIGPSGVDYFHYKDTDVYMKGAWFLHSLRSTLNDDPLFFDILKSFATQYKKKIVHTEDFLRLVNDKTGEDYRWFFDQYLHHREVPELSVYEEYDAQTKEYRLYHQWKNCSADFKMPVTISISYGEATQKKTLRIYPETSLKYTLISTNQAPISIGYHVNLAYFTVDKQKKK